MSTPTLNPPRTVRLWVYIATAIGSALVAYLTAKDIVGDAEVTLWVALSGLANGLAAANTGAKARDDRGHITATGACLIALTLFVIFFALWQTGALPGAR